MGDDATASPFRNTDAKALDDLADLLKLPNWQIRGSAGDFIQCVADYVSRVRDIGGFASDELLEETGYSREDYP